MEKFSEEFIESLKRHHGVDHDGELDQLIQRTSKWGLKLTLVPKGRPLLCVASFSCNARLKKWKRIN